MRPMRSTLAAAVLAALAPAASVAATNVFINEFHYDNASTDVGEFVEIAGPAGTDLSGWSLVLYNGSSSVRAPYNSLTLSGTLADVTGNGYGFMVLTLPTNGIQNGAPDGLALVDNVGNVVQFLSYEGSFEALAGPVAGMTSVDIGAAETSSTPVGTSLQLQGSGNSYEDYGWMAGVTATPNQVNESQDFDGVGGGSGGGDPEITPIYELQGATHTSPYLGQSVVTRGLVTTVDSNGFYLQDPLGDGDDATSDAILVFTSSSPTVAVGDEVEVSGRISEFTPGGASTGNLSTTEFFRPDVTVLSSGNGLPAPVVIGRGGRVPPSQVIDDDSFTPFDPASDGIDFYESLEAMRVTLVDAVAVSPTNRFGETFAVADQGADASGRNTRGGITIQASDFNPERVQIDPDSGILPGFEPLLNTGDLLGDVTGVVGYSFGNFEIYPTEAFAPTSGELAPEVSDLVSSHRKQLTVASYNLLNLDPNDADGDSDLADGRFETIAAQIVDSLHAPDIIGVQEVQDGSGSIDDGVVDADLTFQALIDAIVAAGGPQYAYIDNPPLDGQDGGQPGANIRVGFLYNPGRVELIPGSVQRLLDNDLSDGDAFLDTRKPLAASFEFRGHEIHLVNNHFSSKSGSSPLFGTLQPPENGREDLRVEQAQIVRGFVEDLQAADADAKVVVLGDLNEFQFFPPLKTLKGEVEPVLVNMTESLPLLEQYTYIFEGNSQALDHILVSHNLAEHAAYDVVHLNAEFADQASDHDPALLRVDLQNPRKGLRVATFNASLNRFNAGELITDLSTPDNAQAKTVAEIIQRARPDVILINEFDYDADGVAAELFRRNYLQRSQNGAKPIHYRYVFQAPSNTGIPSGLDLDNDGSVGGPNDAYGFGFFPGQYGMLVLSRYPIDQRHARTFQHFLWKDMPGALLPDDPATPAPADWYSAEELDAVRLSSKSHWDLPIKLKGRTVHLLASHPTPPVFDGPEDRNGTRNHDEIRFWADYVTPGQGGYIFDDRGRRGGLKPGADFVIAGDMNADPNDGDATGNPIALLLESLRVNTEITPVSAGAAEASLRQSGANDTHRGAADFDTADFADGSPGNLRVDYVLPARDMDLLGAGVFWPTSDDPLFGLVGDYPFPSSDHRLVWIDLAKPHPQHRRDDGGRHDDHHRDGAHGRDDD